VHTAYLTFYDPPKIQISCDRECRWASSFWRFERS